MEAAMPVVAEAEADYLSPPLAPTANGAARPPRQLRTVDTDPTTRAPPRISGDSSNPGLAVMMRTVPTRAAECARRRSDRGDAPCCYCHGAHRDTPTIARRCRG